MSVLLSILDDDLMLIFLVFYFSLFVGRLELGMTHILYFLYLSQNRSEELLINY